MNMYLLKKTGQNVIIKIIMNALPVFYLFVIRFV